MPTHTVSPCTTSAHAVARIRRSLRCVALGSVTAVASCFAGCSASVDTTAAKAAVTDFHARLDRAEFAGIYADTGKELKALASESDFTTLLEAVHRKLGPVTSSECKSWRVNFGTGGNVLSLGYQTTFRDGTGVEEFGFLTVDGKPTLVGYHINSKEMLLK